MLFNTSVRVVSPSTLIWNAGGRVPRVASALMLTTPNLCTMFPCDTKCINVSAKALGYSPLFLTDKWTARASNNSPHNKIHGKKFNFKVSYCKVRYSTPATAWYLLRKSNPIGWYRIHPYQNHAFIFSFKRAPPVLRFSFSFNTTLRQHPLCPVHPHTRRTKRWKEKREGRKWKTSDYRYSIRKFNKCAYREAHNLGHAQPALGTFFEFRSPRLWSGSSSLQPVLNEVRGQLQAMNFS